MHNEILARFEAARKIMLSDTAIDITAIDKFIKKLLKVILEGNKIIFLGNGGSAAEATHLAAEFTGKCVVDHRPVSALSLNESVSAITAIANDYGFEHIFSRQVQAHVRKGDILVALSTSGSSRNILNAIAESTALGASVYLWTGNIKEDIPGIEIWRVPSNSTPRIQELHLLWGHIIAEVFEIKLNECLSINNNGK